MHDNEKQIKSYAHELCMKYSGVHLTRVRERNEIIIDELMNKFEISREYATFCFVNNMDR